MAPLEIALRFMDIFFSGQDIERLYEILADDLKFEGPFYRFDSSRDYIDSLLSDPPVGCEYKILQSFENGPCVNLIYEFSKPNICIQMSQLFEFRNNKITKVVLIFDTSKSIGK